METKEPANNTKIAGLPIMNDGKDRRGVTYMDQHAARPIMMRINKWANK